MKFSNEFLLPHVLTDLQHQVLIGGIWKSIDLNLKPKIGRPKTE